MKLLQVSLVNLEKNIYLVSLKNLSVQYLLRNIRSGWITIWDLTMKWNSVETDSEGEDEGAWDKPENLNWTV